MNKLSGQVGQSYHNFPPSQHIMGSMGRYRKYLGLLLLVGLAVSLFRSYQRGIRSRAAIEREKDKIEKLKSENAKLEEDLIRVKSAEYIEAQLRDKLGLAKTGEIVLVLPDAETLKKLAPRLPEEEDVLPLPPWKKWVQLFGFY